jgi:hypothetical protein
MPAIFAGGDRNYIVSGSIALVFDRYTPIRKDEGEFQKRIQEIECQFPWRSDEPDAQKVYAYSSHIGKERWTFPVDTFCTTRTCFVDFFFWGLHLKKSEILPFQKYLQKIGEEFCKLKPSGFMEARAIAG